MATRKTNNTSEQKSKIRNKGKLFSSVKSKQKPLLFWMGLLVIVLLYFGIASTDVYEKYFFQPIVSISAEISSFILNIFGMNTNVAGEVISEQGGFSINISRGCDGVAPIVIYLAAILAFPLKMMYKWKGLLWGIVILFPLNIIRIVSLFLIGKYWPSAFDIMHIEVWQILFIAITVLVWFYWLNWSMKKSQATAA